jgi:hypothetical protein
MEHHNAGFFFSGKEHLPQQYSTTEEEDDVNVISQASTGSKITPNITTLQKSAGNGINTNVTPPGEPHS